MCHPSPLNDAVDVKGDRNAFWEKSKNHFLKSYKDPFAPFAPRLPPFFPQKDQACETQPQPHAPISGFTRFVHDHREMRYIPDQRPGCHSIVLWELICGAQPKSGLSRYPVKQWQFRRCLSCGETWRATRDPRTDRHQK